ncbi:tRNA (32-2'-O)-methyltransferase regulator THADA [Aplochiton taeniatus]
MLSIEDQIASLHCEITVNQPLEAIGTALTYFLNKLHECSRSDVKRCKERCLEEAAQLLKGIPKEQLQSLEEKQLLSLVRLLITMQLQMVNISTASRKLEQILSIEELQKVCMFLEDCTMGREACREACPALLNKVAELFHVLLVQEGGQNGPLCYFAVKVCLQIFQLLPKEVAHLVMEEDQGTSPMQKVLQALLDIIFGQCFNRDTRLLAGTAVAMLINTAPETGGGGGVAAWSLLHVTHSEPWLLTVGGVRVRCSPQGQDGVDRLAVSRGLLTGCRADILTSHHHDDRKIILLLDGLFPLVCALCEEKLECHYFVFEVLMLWLRKMKESLATIWEIIGAPLLSNDSSLRQQLIQVLWNNAESPVEGVSDFVRSAFCLLLEIYEMECQTFGETRETLHVNLLHRITKLPWETKAKYSPLCALLPYVGTDMVLKQYPELPSHLLKCLSANHLSPCASELYKCLIQQLRKELIGSVPHDAPPSELDLANRWAQLWRPTLLKALTSDVTLVQNNSSSHLLPCTLRVFPASVEPLLDFLDPVSPGDLHAWACIMSARRATFGGSPWILESDSASKTLKLALGSVDDKVRLAALNLLCCSPKTKEAPTPEELSTIKAFIPQNLNSDSSPFRQHFQAGVKRFLVRIRDSCLAHVRGRKIKKETDPSLSKEAATILEQGVGFVDWLSQLPYAYLAAGHSFQRKKTVLLLLAAVLETCTDTWSPDKKKGQPPVSMSSLITWARQRTQWDFFSRSKQLVLIGCLEDSTNEIRELSGALLVKFFPPFEEDTTRVLFGRTEQLLCSPRVPEAQMGAVMMNVLLQKSEGQFKPPWLDSRLDNGSLSNIASKTTSVVHYLVKELGQHYLTATTDMMLAAKTKPIQGVLSALEKCLLEVPTQLSEVLNRSLTLEILTLLEKTSLFLLGVLYGNPDTATEDKGVPPSFCDMGNAINSLIAQQGAGEDPGEGEEGILLSEEHSLVLTCCWVSLKEIGIFLGSLVERILVESRQVECGLSVEEMKRASKVFKDILLKCRHWGAVEGCCVGFTKFCASLLSSNDPHLRGIPVQMLQQGLEILNSPRSSSVTRRAAGLPMLILCVASAEEASKARPLLAHSIHTLLDTARTPLLQNWDQTLDLPQVCAVHTLQALVRGSALGVAILQFAPAVAILSLTLLSSPCWAMRNAALQLYSSLCSRMLGQRTGGEEGSTQHGMSPPAFFTHYPTLQPFMLGELRGAARELQGPSGEAMLRLHPSLFPILTLLAKLQAGAPDLTGALSDFLAPLLQLASSPIHSVRVTVSKALVAMTAPSEYMSILVCLARGLPHRGEPCCHNRLHGQLLQIRVLVDAALGTHSAPSDDLGEVVSCVEAKLWLVSRAQRCPPVRGAYLGVVEALRRLCSEGFLQQLSHTLLCELHTPQHRLQVGCAVLHQSAIHFLCGDPRWSRELWEGFSTASRDLRLSLVTWVADVSDWKETVLQQVIRQNLQTHLKGTLLDQSLDNIRAYLAAMEAVMTPQEGDPTPARPLSGFPCAPLTGSELQECLELLLALLENQRGGPEFLSKALCAASLLLSLSPLCSLSPRWCSVLEVHRAPEAPEALRMACATALCLAGVPLMREGMREQSLSTGIDIRLINTGLYLLQDESQPVRMRVAGFASRLCHARRQGKGERKSLYLMQVNQALPFLLGLLLEEYWDCPGTLEVLLGHLPEADLRTVLEDSTKTRCGSLYEQDEANVFSEPSAMCARLLPLFLQLADKFPESSRLPERLSAWAKGNISSVLESLSVCKKLPADETLNPAWLALIVDSRFHGALCAVFTRAALLLRVLHVSDALRRHCDPVTVRADAQEVYRLLARNGVHFPSTFPAAIL